MIRPARELALTALTAATVWIALWSWHSVARGLSTALPMMALIALLVAGAGAVLRLARVPGWAIVLIQLAVAWSAISIRLVHNPVPIHGMAKLRLEDAFIAAGNAAADYATPVPVQHGVLAFVLCGTALVLVLADALARTFRLPAIAGIALLITLGVPFSVIGGGVPAWVFAATSAGYLLQIVAAEGDRLERWGRPLGSTPVSSPRRVAGTVAVGGTATALALVVPLGVPTMHLNLDGFGPGGDGGRITVTNPMVNLQRDLVQGRDVPLVRARTTDPDPTYLRIAVLTTFNDAQWTAGQRSIPADQDANGPVPIPGLRASLPRSDYQYTFDVSPAFASRWLPTPTPLSEIEAQGDWRYDADTDDFLAARNGLTTAGLSYTADRAHVTLPASLLQTAGTGIGQVPALFTELPPDLPPQVGALARQVTASATSPFEQAVALQTWFRSTGRFHYSTATDLGSGSNDLLRFLTEGPGGRTGYCQQFAAAMAVMARTLGIPARVAVGFLAPQREPDGTYVYSSHDMHAWPELYFSGAGWLRFEPTPAARGTAVPAYTLGVRTQSAGTGGGHDPLAQPSSRASSTSSPDQAGHQPLPTPAPATRAADHHPMLEALGWILGVLAVAVLLVAPLLPSYLRRRRRARRLRGSPEDAWAEVRATALDLRIPWADDVSPRSTGALLTPQLRDRDTRLALDRLVAAVERYRYAAAPGPSEVSTDAATVVQGLLLSVPRDVGRWAAWWPRTIFSRDAGSVGRRLPGGDREFARVSD